MATLKLSVAKRRTDGVDQRESNGLKERLSDISIMSYPNNDSRFDCKSTITVLVGGHQKPFIVNYGLMCKYSKFLRYAGSGNWAGRKEKLVRLQDHEAETFNPFLDWMYTQVIDLLSVINTASNDELKTLEGVTLEHRQQIAICEELCRLWTLANYLGDFGCKNKLVETLIPGRNMHMVDLDYWVRSQGVLSFLRMGDTEKYHEQEDNE